MNNGNETSYEKTHEPVRKCIGCGKIKSKKDMVRIMKTHDTNEIIVMPSSNCFGRSSYLCYNKECLNQAIKKKRLQKTLKKDIPISILKYLESILQ